MKSAIIALLLVVSAQTLASPPADVICSYAPSQSRAASVLAGAAGGAAGAVGAIASATGTTAVLHSSGALILTGPGGYIAGTLGTAIVAPTIVVVGVLVGGTAASVELFCAPKNHPEAAGAVMKAAAEFAKRTEGAFAKLKASTAPQVSNVTVKIKKVTGVVADYAFQRSSQ